MHVNAGTLRDLTNLLNGQPILRNQLLHRLNELLPSMFGAAHCVAVDWSIAAGVPRHLRSRDVFFEGWPSGYAEFYHQHFRERDPINSWLASGEARAVDAIPLSALLPHRALVRRRFYKELLQPFDLDHVLTFVIYDGDDLVADFSVVRSVGTGDFDASDLVMAGAIHPVLVKILQAVDHHQRPRKIPVPLQTSSNALAAVAFLTPKEEEVVSLVARGMSNKHAARQLNASPSTIKNHLKSIFRKCEITNRTELSRLAVASGIVDANHWGAPFDLHDSTDISEHLRGEQEGV